MVYNYLFDVLFNVLLFQVKKQEIYREVNWPGWVGVHQINHGQCSHLWTPTDFRHHQCDIWNDENGLGIEFVTIVVWFRMLLSLNGNENQSTYRHKLKFILIILATDKFRFICWKNGWMMIFSTTWACIFAGWPTLIEGEKGFSRSLLSSPFAIIFLESWYWKASNHVLHFTHGQILAWIRLQEPSCH